MENQKSVCLAWATKKRHIAVDGKVLCEAKSTTAGYSVKNGCYNTLALHGLPTHNKLSDDIKGSHGDGLIEFLPLEAQKVKIIETSICSKCLKKYKKLIS